jgi:hypothetical protein
MRGRVALVVSGLLWLAAFGPGIVAGPALAEPAVAAPAGLTSGAAAASPAAASPGSRGSSAKQAPVPLGPHAQVADAFAQRGMNACTWTVGSPGVEKTFSFDALAGTYEMTSFRNTLVQPVREYVTASAPSAEFRFTWDGATLSGDGGGWSCSAGRAWRIDAGGAPALQLDVTLSRPSAGVRVTKHYVVYPDVALIREWVDYANTDTAPHELAQPSFLEQKVMGDTAADTDLFSIGGADNYRLTTTPLSADYSDTISGNASLDHMPWFALWNRARAEGIYVGFDYFGNWSLPVGQRDGSGMALSLFIPDYDQPLAAGGSLSTPKAFDGVYRTDLDDMTNRLLDWQYRYMWDYTRAPYFTAVRNEGFWCEGSSWGSCAKTVQGWDQPGTMQKVFDLIDSNRAMGVDTYHRDNGWWDFQGDWGGEDWKFTHDYLAKSGMNQIIYMPIYYADDGSQALKDHPDLFPGNYLDMTSPAGVQWAIDTLVSKAKQWGDYEWRPDFGGFGSPAYDQGFRSIIQGFLDARPGSGFHAVNGGGSDYGYDYLRFADGGSFTDFGGVSQIDGASRIFPVDKLSGVPEYVSVVSDCNDTWSAQQLDWNPDMYGDSSDPAIQECVRKMSDLYHYITAQGVAGRWVGQYHPHASDAVDSNWFQRVSGDRQRSLLVYTGGSTNSFSNPNITVYPKGLSPRQMYDVRFQYQTGVAHRSGADLMAGGIKFTGAVHPGELVWLNMPGHPGSGADHTPPSAPAQVTATTGTNMNYPGVEVAWTPASDDNWLSYYQVLRDGNVIGTVAKGTFYFDHTPAASPTATYAVRAVDGDGNASAVTTAAAAGGPASRTVDDSSAAITYTGNWIHQTGMNGPYAGTQSGTSGFPCHAGCQGFGGVQGQGGWGYQDGPAALCHQACQQFGGTQDAGGWSYQEQPPPPPPTCHLACQGFSGTQGANGWSYQASVGGVWTDIFDYHDDLGIGGDCCGWYDLAGGDFTGLISARFIWGGAGHDTARAWTAPKDGVVDITSQAIPFSSGNESVLTITVNGQPVWGPATLDGTTTPVDTSVANVPVAAGDVVRFEIKDAGVLSFRGLLEWDPDIHYQGDPPLQPPPPPPPFVNMTTYHSAENFSGDGPYWHDAHGYISARLVQPDGSRDLARTWTAPADGVVDVSGHVADDVLDSAGADSTVTITKDNQIIWGPQVITAGDTTGVDAGLAGVPVSAGDVIRFQVAAGSGTVAWDPDVTYQGDPPTVVAPPAWADIASFHPAQDFGGDGPYWHDDFGYVSARLLQSSLRRDAARTWTAPADGTVDIAGHASGGGAVVSITRNGQQLWGPQAAGEVDTNISGVTVSAGDVIRFQVAAGPGTGSQLVRWDPDISYAGGPPPGSPDCTASWTFTGSQVTWYTKLGPDKGTAQVSIDGKLDATIDLYAPDVNNYSIPIYTKTFPVSGTHTITITPTGNANARSTAPAVDVDGFRAVTGAVSVTEETGSKVTYSGPGWASQPDAAASAGRVMVSSHPGDTVSFRFNGRSITWVGRICPSCGVADVYVDGRYAGRFDAYVYRGPDVWQAAMFQYSWDRPGSHVIKLVVTDQPDWAAQGSQIYVDNFRTS